MPSARIPDDTLNCTRELPNGDELRIYAAHGRVYLQTRVSGFRLPTTFPIPADLATDLFGRGIEIAALAPGTKRGSP